MDKLMGEMVKSSVLSGVGLGGSKLAYELQENVYNRPNSLEFASEFLHNPDYLTSFTYPLTLMYAMRAFFAFEKVMNQEMGKDKSMDVVYDIAIKLTPIVVVGLNIWHEVLSRPSYQDNQALDILAGITAGLVYTLTTSSKKELKNGLNIFKKLFKKDNKPHIATEVLQK